MSTFWLVHLLINVTWQQIDNKMWYCTQEHVNLVHSNPMIKWLSSEHLECAVKALTLTHRLLQSTKLLQDIACNTKLVPTVLCANPHPELANVTDPFVPFVVATAWWLAVSFRRAVVSHLAPHAMQCHTTTTAEPYQLGQLFACELAVVWYKRWRHPG